MRIGADRMAADEREARPRQPSDRKRGAAHPTGWTASVEFLQRSVGNHAVSQLLGRTSAACPPAPAARALLDEGSAGREEFVPQPIGFDSVGPDASPPPINDEGLIDGEWASETAATVFVNGGKAGSGVVNWAGGNGGTTPGIGSVTSVAPVIKTRAAGDAGTAAAWVEVGTGTVNVSRNYYGVLIGANATYYITAAAAGRIDTHEQNHITHSKMAHDAHLQPLETRIAARTGEAKALSQGATEAAAKTALEAELKWNDSLTKFRNQDNTYNLPGGTVDTADSASVVWYHDLGPRTMAGVNYAHYVDV